MKQLQSTYEYLISTENLLAAWREFKRGKTKKVDVVHFDLTLMDNILNLRRELRAFTYTHGDYHAFNIADPKPRSIHKATVRDRLLHHAIYRSLYWFFHSRFIFDSYSCRIGKGTHKALDRFGQFGRQISKNNSRTCWVLKCDVRKFFASVDHQILFKILERHVNNQDILWLLYKVVGSFSSIELSKGLPLGNLTSQLLVNVYMNEFDQYMKHVLWVKKYIRYADDFVIFSADRTYLESLLQLVRQFLWQELKLELHPDKVSLITLASGVDFLGWVHFPDHRVLRTSTKRRMFKRLAKTDNPVVVASYRGLLKHGNTQKLQIELDRLIGRV